MPVSISSPFAKIPCSLFPVPCSLFPVPCSLFPVPCSLFPVPRSPFDLVLRHGWVYVITPARDAADQVADAGKAKCAQLIRRPRASLTRVTVQNELRVGVECRDDVAQLRQRDELIMRNARVGMFVRFPNIDDARDIAAGNSL